MLESTEEPLSILSGFSLLVLEDDLGIVRDLARVLGEAGAEATGVGSLSQARLSLGTLSLDAVLADLQLKNRTGLERLPEYLDRNPDGAFYLITGHHRIANAVEALRHGVRPDPETPVEPIALARDLVDDLTVERSSHDLAEQLAPYLSVRDPVMIKALGDLPQFAASDEPVLIQGETGTGKELVARALHGLGPRARGPFIAVNCGAIPQTMLEAELFGHEKGAFTGATRQHRGRFEQAHGGTLFLDEIGEMPPAAQVSLLRVLEEGEVHRVGSERGLSVDVRVVAATHRPLEECVESVCFRQDLLFRLNVLVIELPPLRERAGDIELLARRFLDKSLADMGKSGGVPTLSPEALALLAGYRWPGNVRELRNVMVRLAVRLPDGVPEVGANLLTPMLPARSSGVTGTAAGVLIPKGTTLADAQWLLIDAALKEAGYNRTKAAKRLGIGERTLRRKLNES